jgi:hypothetical protein
VPSLKLQAWILKSFWIVNLFSPAKISIGNIINRMTKYFMLPPWYRFSCKIQYRVGGEV